MYSASALVLLCITGGAILEQLDHIQHQITALMNDKSAGIVHRLRQLGGDYIAVVKLSDHVNSCFGVIVFLEVFHQFVLLVTGINYLQVTITNSDFPTISIIIAFEIIASIQLLCFTLVGEHVAQQVCHIQQMIPSAVSSCFLKLLSRESFFISRKWCWRRLSTSLRTSTRLQEKK